MGDRIFKIHDKLVHGTFSSMDNAAALIRSALPAELAARIDFGTLEPRPTKHTGPHLEEGHSDLLYAATIDGEEVLIYVLVEHLSSSDRFAVVRLLLYLLLTWSGICRDEQPEHLPLIIPIVLHHSEDGWTAPTRFEDVIDPAALALEEARTYVPAFEFLLDDISAQSDEELRCRQLPLLGSVALWLLRDARNPERFFAHVVGWGQSFVKLANDPASRSGIALVMSYIIEVLGIDRANQLRQILTQLTPAAEATMQSIADGYIEKGIEKGRRELVLHLLTKKFGPLPDDAVARLDAATLEELEQVADRLLDAQRLDDVFET